MKKWALLYNVHRNIHMVPFFYITKFLKKLDNINFMKIKILKPKQKKFNSKLNGLHVKFIKYL
jgi:hypothetical protein